MRALVALFVTLMCLLSAGAALSATETGHRTLDSLDDLHTTRTEAIDLKAIEAAQARAAQKEAAGR